MTTPNADAAAVFAAIVQRGRNPAADTPEPVVPPGPRVPRPDRSQGASQTAPPVSGGGGFEDMLLKLKYGRPPTDGNGWRTIQ